MMGVSPKTQVDAKVCGESRSRREQDGAGLKISPAHKVYTKAPGTTKQRSAKGYSVTFQYSPAEYNL